MINPLDIATKGYLKDSLAIASKGYLSSVIEEVVRRTTAFVKMPRQYLAFPRFKLSKR